MKMTIEELQKACEDWNERSTNFADIMANALVLLNMSERDMAYEIVCVPSSVTRWAENKSKPMPGIQKYVINKVILPKIKQINGKS